MRVIAGLRSGDQTGAVARRKIFSTIGKQFAERKQMQKLAVGIYQYAKRKFEEKQETQPMTTVTTADDLLQEHIDKAASRQAMLRDAIAQDQRANPGRSRADSIDKVLYSRPVADMVQLEEELTKLGVNTGTLPKHRTTASIDFSQPGVRGRTGYSSADAVTHPRNQAAGENPIIRDHHQLLEDIKNNKVPYTDPKVQALVALERKNVMERG
jgi:hypothetical protein